MLFKLNIHTKKVAFEFICMLDVSLQNENINQATYKLF